MMRIMRSRWLLMVLWLATGSVFAGTFTFTIKVVDAERKLVSKADVTLFWHVSEGSPQRGTWTATDENGKAVLQPADSDENRAVLVLSADRKLGALVRVSKAEKEVTAVLGPTVRVTGRLECRELSTKPAWANTMVTADGFSGRFAQYMGESARFEFVLPAGKYTFRSYGTDVQQLSQVVTLSADKAEHDLGTFDLKATPVARLKGKAAPGWDITAARGVKRNVKLSDYKGKWVYCEFWGFW
jgi:hypothetical protein